MYSITFRVRVMLP